MLDESWMSYLISFSFEIQPSAPTLSKGGFHKKKREVEKPGRLTLLECEGRVDSSTIEGKVNRNACHVLLLRSSLHCFKLHKIACNMLVFSVIYSRQAS